ncbi:MAG: hypothetical protein ACT4OD_05490 [Candidatus Nitrosotenuis sp.]
MTEILIKVTKKELKAIQEFANMCGETIPNIIRKIMIQEITFMKSRAAIVPKSYAFNMLIPDGVSEAEEYVLIEKNYNKIRKILGLRHLNLGWV